MSMHHPANPVLDVRQLSVAYGKVEAVSEVSLAVTICPSPTASPPIA